jgi:uncharacterized repeat protein (TIGR03803 family)
MASKWCSCAVLVIAMLAAASLQAQILGTLYNFNGAPNGALPIGGLVRIDGRFYGTTVDGGADSTAGTVFEVDLKGNETTLHSFSGSPDGYGPLAGLIKDSDGNLYGTTAYGGLYNFGTVFEVSETGAETVLYSFSGYPADGANPQADLVRDAAGNLYGTTQFGGPGPCQDNNGNPQGCGTVFVLSTSGAETVLHGFGSETTDGQMPIARLLRDSAGNLYGTTYSGGTQGMGTVFKVTPSGTETVLYSFVGTPDGSGPEAGLILHAGIFYGTTYLGGASNYGTVFAVTEKGQETVLYSFSALHQDGHYPAAALVRDSSGNLYGTTLGGGIEAKYCHVIQNGCGVIFKLSSAGKETVLHRFAGYPTEGSAPISDLLRDSLGNLYGTTDVGGNAESGTVFEFAP